MQGSLRKGSFVQMGLALVTELLVQPTMEVLQIRVLDFKLNPNYLPALPPYRDLDLHLSMRLEFS